MTLTTTGAQTLLLPDLVSPSVAGSVGLTVAAPPKGGGETA